MTGRAPLGAPDVRVRWCGLPRGLFVGAVAVMALVVVAVRVVLLRPLVAVILSVGAVSALPLDGVSVAVWILGWVRRHVMSSRVLVRGPRVTWTFSHHGDRTFSGAADVMNRDITSLIDTRAASDALVVVSSPAPVAVSVRGVKTAPSSWWSPTTVGPAVAWERGSYLRTPRGVARILRVRRFGASATPLCDLQRRVPEVSVLRVIETVGATTARRVVERRHHRLQSDLSLLRSWGFRSRSSDSHVLRRAAQQESLVSSGHALSGLGVFVVVRAPHRAALRRRVAAVMRAADQVGVVLDRGRERQGMWWRTVEGVW